MELREVACESRPDAVVVLATGDIDSNSVERLIVRLKDALDAAAGHPAHLVIVDLQQVKLLGSAGLNALLDCHEDGLAAGVSVRLVADHPEVLQPIQVTELDRILEIYPTVPDAVQGR
ncbi:STAS domain-containing protein [Mycobacterium asiaticum]|uniref:Anti-sigma factor antagonist n=1 Tax=Mycobacterium asiaticum TaxID=1790 RepID=A0A1A3N3U8_MYCAS|nr:STAS domain-containing protein [Mycobacterium asiaticum]OBK15047.1 anti-anti-sigma factor [Mycobacterium asiaticum]